MIDDKRLAKIEERAGNATPGPWVHNGSASVWIDAGASVERVADFSPKQADYPLPKWVSSLHNANFVAHARQDVPDLCASLREAWHLIWIMSQDQEAYLRGKEDGRRECVEALGELAAQQRREYRPWATRQSTNIDLRATALEVAADVLRKEHDLPPPLPPDAMAAENARLRKQVQDLLNRTPQKID